MISKSVIPQGELVDLTDEEFEDAIRKLRMDRTMTLRDWNVGRTVIAKFKEKNTPPFVPQGEPVAFMFKVKRTTKARTVLDEFAAIDYFPQDNEEIVSKEPLIYAAPVQREQQEPVAWALMHKNGLEFNAGYGMVKTLQEAEDMQRRHLGNLKVVPLYNPPPSVEAAIEATKEKAIEALQGVATGRIDVVEAIRSMK